MKGKKVRGKRSYKYRRRADQIVKISRQMLEGKNERAKEKIGRKKEERGNEEMKDVKKNDEEHNKQ